MVSALVFCLVAAVPVPLDWNGLPLQKALENYGNAAGLPLRCEPALAQEPIFAWAPSTSPKEVMDRLADVMVATWTKQPDGSFRLIREAADRRKLQALRQREIERVFGPQIRAVIESAHLDEPVTVADATKAIKAMIDSRAKPMTEWERMRSNRALDAKLAGGRLMARLLNEVGPTALAAIADEDRAVLASMPTRRQIAIPNAQPILSAFAKEHEILNRAADQTGPPPLSSTGIRAQAWFSEPLKTRPARIQLIVERNAVEGAIGLAASVFHPNGEIAFSTRLTMRETAPHASFPASLRIPADPPARAALLSAVKPKAGLATPETRRAALALLTPDPLASAFGERLRAVAKANGRNLMARVSDHALRFTLAEEPKGALTQMLETSSLTDEGGWMTVALRDPLEAESTRVPREALFHLLTHAADNDGSPRLAVYLDFLRACPNGIFGSLAADFWPHIGGVHADNAVNIGALRFVALCNKNDLSQLATGERVPAGRLSLAAQSALERLVFRQPYVRFQVNERTIRGEYMAVEMGERCEPTFRVPGPMTDAVRVRLVTVATDFALGENFGNWTSLTPAAIASSRRARLGKGDGMTYDRFRPGVQYQFHFEVSIDRDTTFTHQSALIDIDLKAAPIPYEKLPAAFRRRVEEEMEE